MASDALVAPTWEPWAEYQAAQDASGRLHRAWLHVFNRHSYGDEASNDAMNILNAAQDAVLACAALRFEATKARRSAS